MSFTLSQVIDEEIQNYPEYLTINALVTGEQNITGAITQFTGPVNKLVGEEGKDSEAVSDRLWGTWNSLLAVVAETPPEKQRNIVEFVRTLKKTSENGEVWTNLQQLGWSVREAWNYTPADAPQYGYRWVNVNAFVAQLTSTEPASGPLDYSLNGLWTLRSALEEQSNDKTDAQAGAVWAEYAAKSIWKMCKDGKEFQGRMGAPGSAYSQNKSWKGFSKERWQVWYEEFGKLKDRHDDKDTKTVLEAAIRKMQDASAN